MFFPRLAAHYGVVTPVALHGTSISLQQPSKSKICSLYSFGELLAEYPGYTVQRWNSRTRKPLLMWPQYTLLLNTSAGFKKLKTRHNFFRLESISVKAL